MRPAVFLILPGLMLLFCMCSRADVPEQHKQEIGIWSSFSFNTTSLGALTDEEVKGRKLLLIGFRYGRMIKQKETFSILYTFDVLPVAMAFHSSVQNAGADLIPKNVYGFGVSPIGFTFRFRTARRMQPQFGCTGGFLHFQDPVPNPQGTNWNFTATGGGGLRFVLSHGRSIDAGYMFHHISNGRRPRENPSLNTNLVYFGFSFL